jgi:lipid-binding SYLF domain-containing protein
MQRRAVATLPPASAARIDLPERGPSSERNPATMNRNLIVTLVAALFASIPLAACHVAPKAENRESFKTETDAARKWFSSNVKSFDRQSSDGGGYIIFPSVGQAGAVFFGGTFGRGAVFNASGTQVGWAALSRGSFGLQLGAQGFKMAMILEDEATMRRFKDGKWTGDVSATAVAADQGAAADAQFTDGVIVYVGDQSGLMAGISIALANVRYKNIDDVE